MNCADIVGCPIFVFMDYICVAKETHSIYYVGLFMYLCVCT